MKLILQRIRNPHILNILESFFMKRIILLSFVLWGASFSQADQLLASWDTFREGGASTTGGLSVNLDQFGAGPSIENGSLILSESSQRAWIDISSLNISLSQASYSFVMDVSKLQLGNGPVFSLGTGSYNTQATAFGFSTDARAWSFSDNGNNMNVLGETGSTFGTYSGKLTVNFLAENGATYVEAFLGDIPLVSKTEINYEKSVLYLSGLTLGGWASTADYGSSMTINTLAISQIPEPASVSLGFIGLGILLIRRRRY